MQMCQFGLRLPAPPGWPKKGFRIFFEKPLQTLKPSLYNSGLFGRNDKRQNDTTEMGA
jgi:hypothetical protein